jgi:hypothetical protein
MDGERIHAALRGSYQPARVYPFRSGCMPCRLCKKIRGVAADSTIFRDSKRNEAYVPATPRSLGVVNLIIFIRLKVASEDWGVETPNEPLPRHHEQVSSLGCRGSARHP